MNVKMTMKAMSCVSILLLGVLIGGCTTVSQESKNTSTTAVADTPNLLGNWSGTIAGYTKGAGYDAFSNDTMIMKVTEQKGRVFSGDIGLANQSGVWKAVTFAGVVGRDGRTLSMVEGKGGHSSGDLVAPGEIEFIYSDEAEPFTIAINSLKRV
jgi:hypothetical protein